MRTWPAPRSTAWPVAPGVLEDYADLAEGLVALVCVTGEARYLAAAGDLLDAVLARFADRDGVLHDVAADDLDPVLARVRRPRDVADGPTPSGTAAAASALLSYAALTGSSRHRAAAERALAGPLLLAPEHPLAAGWALAGLEALLDGPRQIAVVGPPGDRASSALRRVALAATAPGAVLAAGPPDTAGLPLLADRPLVDGRPAAYVCRGFVCDRPTTDPSELARTAVLRTLRGLTSRDPESGLVVEENRIAGRSGRVGLTWVPIGRSLQRGRRSCPDERVPRSAGTPRGTLMA